jgi:ribosomal protein S6--L-glutamate ligase
MNILIYYSTELLGRSPRSEPLEEFARKRGHDCFCYSTGKGDLNAIPFQPNVILTRLSHSGTEQDYKNLDAFPSALKINTPESTLQAANKVSYYSTLCDNQFPVPSTMVYRGEQDDGQALAFAERYKFPLIAKKPVSSQGKGVALVQNRNDIINFQSGDGEILLQEFIGESSGRHVRCLVVGEKILVAHENRAQNGDFRSNACLGATLSRINHTDEMRDVALGASGLLGLEIAGIDLLYSNRGMLVCDINANPSLRYFHDKMGIEIADEIIGYAEKRFLAL